MQVELGSGGSHPGEAAPQQCQGTGVQWEDLVPLLGLASKSQQHSPVLPQRKDGGDPRSTCHILPTRGFPAKQASVIAPCRVRDTQDSANSFNFVCSYSPASTFSVVIERGSE